MNHEQRIRHNNQVKDGLSKVDPSFLPTPGTEVDLILQKATDVVQAVAVITREIDAAARAAGTPHDVKTLVKIISRKFMEGFDAAYTREEALFMLAYMHTDVVIDQLTGNTQTSKIIKPI